MQKSPLQLLVIAGDMSDSHRLALDELVHAVVGRLHQSGEDVEPEIVPLAANRSDDRTQDTRPSRSRTYLLIPEDEFGLGADEWQRRIERIRSSRRPSSVLFIVDWNPDRARLGFIRLYLREIDTPLHFVRLNREGSAAASPAIDMAAEIGDLILRDEMAPLFESGVETRRPIESARPRPAELTQLIELRGQASVDRVSVPKTGLRDADELSVIGHNLGHVINAIVDIEDKPRRQSAGNATSGDDDEGYVAALESDDSDDAWPAPPPPPPPASFSFPDLKSSDSYSRGSRQPEDWLAAPPQRPAFNVTRWFLIAASMALLGAFLFRRELGYLTAPLMKLFGSATPPPAFPAPSFLDAMGTD